MGFQTIVKSQPAPAVAGDFAGNNPRSSVLSAVEGGLRTKSGETITVGYFAWAGSDGYAYNDSTSPGSGAQVGFVARQPNEPNVAITAFLGEATMNLLDGVPVTLMNGGEYWADFGTAGAAMGATVYATAATGAPTTTSSGNVATGFTVVSPALVPAVTDSATTIAADTGIMTVAVVSSGVLAAGQKLSGTGISANTYITAQLTGTAGGAGTYQTNSLGRAAVSATTVTASAGTLAKISKVAA